MKTKVAKWGRCLAVRIPATVARQLRAREGDSLEVVVESRALALKPLRDQQISRRYTLGELLDGMTKENLHPPTEWGPPRGKEIW